MDPWTSGELFSELGFWDEGSLGSLVVPILHLSSENKNSLRLFNVRVFFVCGMINKKTFGEHDPPVI
jgi:hypothetical protein